MGMTTSFEGKEVWQYRNQVSQAFSKIAYLPDY